MISKSLSRKTPSFGQLAGYMSESGYMNSQKSDERYEIFQHCFSSRHEDIAAEFFENSQLLRKRKNGNYLYHEILSISIEDGVERRHAKDALREIALGYIAERCPNNMVYGCLHDDHSDHIHYHLMISANEKGSDLRHRLSKKKFDSIKRDMELKVLRDYPELKQRALITASRDEKKLSRKAAEEKRRNGKLERQEFARKMIIEAMLNTKHFDEFIAKLEAKNARYYKRGKNHAVEILHEA